MVEITFDMTTLGAIVAILIFGVIMTKIWRNNSEVEGKINKKRFDLQEKYVKDLEKDNDGYEDEVISLKAQLARKERAPSIPEGKIEDSWGDIIPSFIGDISEFVPKKLKPLFENKELQSVIINKIIADPEKFKPIINKFVSKALGKDAGNAQNQGTGL